MDGIFVDNNSRLCLITQTHSDANKLEWHINRADEDNFYGNDGIIKRQRMSAKCVDMYLCKENMQGVFDGKDCITWNNGEKWRRLRISYDQIQALKYRPYVPLTVHVLYLMYNMIYHIYRSCLKTQVNFSGA